MVKRTGTWRALMLGAAIFSLAACDNEILLWPWVEPSDETVEDDAPPPPPPLEPVNPLPTDADPPVEGDAPDEIAVVDPDPTSDEDGVGEDVDGAEPEGDVAEGDDPDASTGSDATDAPMETVEPAFFYYPAGDLEPGSGQGARDETIYVPDMVFPIKDAPSYLQSQVYRPGGSAIGGDQCDPSNFEAPMRDNYCEIRSRDNSTPYCPVGRVHLGQDIRVGTPAGCEAERRRSPSERTTYAAVATEDGVISNIGRYTVNLRTSGRIYRYMHLNMAALEVELGDTVTAGQTLGYVSNDFGGTPTTFHLHFEIKHNTVEHGWTWAPPYMSLIRAYERREGAPGAVVSDDASLQVASD